MGLSDRNSRADMSTHGGLKSTWRPSPPPVSRDDCPICQGTGWELVSEARGAVARPCSCRSLDRVMRIRDRVHIPRRYEHCTLDSYRPLNFSQTRALAETRKLLERFPAPCRDVFFAGGPGVGKTHLAVGALRELMCRLTEDALFVDFIEFVGTARARAAASLSARSGWDRLLLCPLLVLDNFGMMEPGREDIQLLMKLLRGRWRLRRTTIYTGERLRVASSPLRASGPQSSATQTFLLGLPPEFALVFLAQVRVVTIVGEDYRRNRSGSAELF
jgi:DNA replication protein DnaC